MFEERTGAAGILCLLWLCVFVLEKLVKNRRDAQIDIF